MMALHHRGFKASVHDDRFVALSTRRHGKIPAAPQGCAKGLKAMLTSTLSHRTLLLGFFPAFALCAGTGDSLLVGGQLVAALERGGYVDMLFEKNNAALKGFNQWTIDGAAFSMDHMTPMFHLRKGRRYRVRMRNASDDIHPVHLHRHGFELTRVAGKPTAGIMKDVVMLGGYQAIEFDFIADNPGMTLFHCHQQLHMDFGFMALFDYV
jgi:Multicopper oxidase